MPCIAQSLKGDEKAILIVDATQCWWRMRWRGSEESGFLEGMERIASEGDLEMMLVLANGSTKNKDLRYLRHFGMPFSASFLRISSSAFLSHFAFVPSLLQILVEPSQQIHWHLDPHIRLASASIVISSCVIASRCRCAVHDLVFRPW